jgi:Tfp pilus assembly protein PilF
MAADFVLATVLASLAPSAAVTDYPTAPAEVDVAYEELRDGNTAAAIRQLEGSSESNDPARLINLGTAYARDGRPAEAEAMFRAAMKSEQRWLELADGSWHNSQQLARLALAQLEERRSLALR